jgi:hypothetical protein
MSSIEEKLWNYIDGSCSADEQQAISLLIEHDEMYRDKYLELLQLNQDFASMELEEPPMAFTYNVMETIRTENAQKPLKAAINTNIIKGISGFFVFTILTLLFFLLSNIHWTSASTGIHLTSFTLPDISKYLTGPVMQGFLFFDVVLALFLFDTYLRKRSILKQS